MICINTFVLLAVCLCYPTWAFPDHNLEKSWGGDSCQQIRLYGPQGIISTPGYPISYVNHTSCTWYILGQPGDIITISFDDIDIEEDPEPCEARPCCKYNWVKIGPSPDGREKKYCGKGHFLPAPFLSTTNQVSIKFHTAATQTVGGRGFELSYMLGKKNSPSCKSGEFRCDNGKCIMGRWQCNWHAECEDGSDEWNCEEVCSGSQKKCGSGLDCFDFPSEHCDGILDCENGADELGCGGCPKDTFLCHSGNACYDSHRRCDGTIDCPDFSDELNCGFCGQNATRCGATSSQCYDPFRQRCNREMDCTNGEDERSCFSGCREKILCLSGSGCYSSEERCNGVAQCGDSSDEKNCGHDMCRSDRGGFLCKNGHCIREAWKCDRTDDCGDSSDEDNCLKNSIITAAVMGSLVCGLLLVIAVSCTCKIYSLRTLERQEVRRETPLSRMEQEFFYREPPPSYAIAVGEGGHPLYVENVHYETRPPRRVRRPRRNRRNPPNPPTEVVGCGSTNDRGTSMQQENIASVLGLAVPVHNAIESNRHLGERQAVGNVVGTTLPGVTDRSETCMDTAVPSNIQGQLPNQAKLHEVEDCHTLKNSSSNTEVTNDVSELRDDKETTGSDTSGNTTTVSISLSVIDAHSCDDHSVDLSNCDESDTRPLIP